MNFWYSLAAFFLTGLTFESAQAFPDFIRHQYVNCTTCHIAPSGGNALNEYGRALSAELASQNGDELEAQLFNGKTGNWKKPEWLILGGQLRILQIHKETPDLRVGATIPMQTELEVGATNESWTFLLGLFKADAVKHKITSDLVRAFGMYQDENGFIGRFGKFAPQFGILVPYHTLATRDGIGMGRDSERNLAEISLLRENWSASFSVGQETKVSARSGKFNSLFVGQFNWNLYDSGKVGLGYYVNDEKQMGSLNGLLGMANRFTYLTEFVYTKNKTTNSIGSKKESIVGLAHFSQFLWEQSKGVNVYFLEDYLKTDLGDDFTLSNSYGAGIRYNPRPHFDFDGAFLKKRIIAIDDRYDNWVWIQGHYYF